MAVSPWPFVAVTALAIAFTALLLLLLRRDRSKREDVVLLTHFNVGRSAQHNNASLDWAFLTSLVERHVLAFPHATRLVHVTAKNRKELVDSTLSLLRQGYRTFLGVLTSADMLALEPLAKAYPGAVFISTASTADIQLPHNMFRTANPDKRFVAYLPAMLRRVLGDRSMYLFIDNRSVWATKLGPALAKSFGSSVQVVHDFVAAPEPDSMFVLLTENDEEAFRDMQKAPWAAALPSGTPVCFGDPSVYSRTWFEPGSPFAPGHFQFFAFGSMKMLASCTAAKNILGSAVAPNICNLMIAGRLALQLQLLRGADCDGVCAIQRMQVSRSETLGTGMFDDNNDRVDIECGLVQWTGAAWHLAATHGKHVALGDFHADFPLQQ